MLPMSVHVPVDRIVRRFEFSLIAIQAAQGHHMGGNWTCLYSSDRDGFSMNRLQHHCFDYREPSIMVLTCQDKEGKEFSYAIGTDREWRCVCVCVSVCVCGHT